ncbi:MAG: peptidase, partial [Nitrospiria bacterium]
MSLENQDPFQVKSSRSNTQVDDPLRLIDQLLSKTPQDDRRHPLLYRLRENLLEEELGRDKVQGEIKRLNQVIEKVTTPANRLGTLLALTSSGLAHIVVGGADYYANIDPRIKKESLKVGSQVLVNEAFVVIESIGDDGDGQVVKISALLSDGRLRVGQEQGSQSTLLLRSSHLEKVVLKVGEEVRLDPSHRVAIEKIELDKKEAHVLEETPSIRWDEIGGQKKAIEIIR